MSWFYNERDGLSNGGFVAIVCVAILAVLVLPMSLVISIPAGHVGVVHNMGHVTDDTLSPGGPYFVKPWKTITRVNVQVRKLEEPATVPTKNGLSVKMTAVMLYRMDPTFAPAMVRDVGEDYEAKMVDPVFRNAVRDTCAEFDPESLYNADRLRVETGVLTRVTKELLSRGFLVDQIMLQDPVLPDVVTQRIQAKVGAEQDAIRMESVLKQKELEAKAKVVEAEGVAKAQAIIKKDLDENYLIYLWIEALKESAKHNNATIYIPTGTDGMPLFSRVREGKK